MNKLRYITELIAILVMSSFFVNAQQKKNNPVQWEIEADTLVSRGEYEGALSLYTKVIQKSKFKSIEDYDVLYKRAYVNFQLRAFESALADLDKFIAVNNDDQAFLLRAYIYQETNNPTGVLQQLDTMLARYPDNDNLLRWRVQALMESEKYEEAKFAIVRLLDIKPDFNLQLSLGLVHYYLNEYEEAFIVFDNLIKANPTQLEPFLYASSLCLEDGHYNLALQYLDAGLKQHPSEPTLVFYKGIVLYELKDEAEACRYLRKAYYSGIEDAADYLEEYCFGTEE